MFSFIKIERNIPRWTIFLSDILICLFAIFLAYLLRFNFAIPERHIATFILVIPFVLIVRIISFLVFKTYAGIIRHTSTEDGVRIFLTISVGAAVFAISNIIHYLFFDKYFIPFGIIIIDYFVTIFFMTSIRLMVKLLYFELRTADKKRMRTIIYGAGEEGLITKRTLDSDPTINYKVIAFIDENKKLHNKKMEGITIYNEQKGIHKVLRDNNIDLLIFSAPDISRLQKNRAVNLCLKYKVKVLNTPPMTKWINGELSFNQIKGIKIEDLLGREPIKLDSKEVKQQINGKNILITGAAGSIGTELTRQILTLNAGKVILLDQAETALYNLELELNDTYKKKDFETVIGDVRNKERMINVFRTFKPKIVYHAAAYKHVPSMEENPTESVLTNVLGTQIITDLAVAYGVEKFVFISTDKAVNPTNVMGASKRIAEMYVQGLDRKIRNSDENDGTRFITTRFGNVLGSNGSVIEIFRNQIASGRPVTVTDPEVTRYFMTIPEACQLVLEAGAMGNGGELYMFDMGESVKIVELAKKMIKLSGFELGKDIQLVFTGLRPGEKLYEELLNNQENTLSTHHPKIMIAKVAENDFETISKAIFELIQMFEEQDNLEIVKKMKSIVPEFISNNSVFEVLDTKELVH